MIRFLFLLCFSLQQAVQAAVRINEFLASNDNGLQDFEGDNEDWIELYNDGNDGDIDLLSYALSDDPNDPTKWTFPSSVVIPAGGYLVVFCSDKADDDTGTELHTNFKISAGGEYLALFDAAGFLLSEFAPMAQTTDQSYGINDDGDAVYFPLPTPGEVNGLSLAPPVAFSHPRGFYSEAFTLELMQTSSNTQIRYTLDGSAPSATNGQVYTSPIAISGTACVRAASFGDSSRYIDETSNIPTHTFLFLEEVIHQSATIPGFPSGKRISVGSEEWAYVPIDFAMDPAVVSDYSDEIISALMAIPTMVLTTSSEDIYGEPGGFYFAEGDNDIEKMVSMEVFDGVKTEHVFVGVESHSHNSLKRSLRLNFRSSYGTKEWETSLLQDFPTGGSATDKLRRIVLRGGSNRSWARNREPDATSYAEDQFYRDTQIAVAGYGSHGTFVHLYLNGVYEGVYNPVERPDDTFGEAYFGGDDDHWFFTNHGGAGSKDSTRWDYLLDEIISRDLENPDNYAELEEYLDVTAFADYMILNFYVGMTDWPENNWYVIARTDEDKDGPLAARFVGWDGEYILDRRQLGRKRMGATIQKRFLWNTPYQKNAIIDLWHSVWKNDGFKELFHARVEMHTSSGGALSVEVATARWDAITGFLESAIIGESARWGDSLRSLGRTFDVTRTRDVDYVNQVAKVRNLLLTNTEQFLEEVDLLSRCDSFFWGMYCSFMTVIFWLAETLGVMSWFYR